MDAQTASEMGHGGSGPRSTLSHTQLHPEQKNRMARHAQPAACRLAVVTTGWTSLLRHALHRDVSAIPAAAAAKPGEVEATTEAAIPGVVEAAAAAATPGVIKAVATANTAAV